MDEQQTAHLRKVAAVVSAESTSHEREVDADSTVLPTANYTSPVIRHTEKQTALSILLRR